MKARIIAASWYSALTLSRMTTKFIDLVFMVVGV